MFRICNSGRAENRSEIKTPSVIPWITVERLIEYVIFFFFVHFYYARN